MEIYVASGDYCIPLPNYSRLLRGQPDLSPGLLAMQERVERVVHLLSLYFPCLSPSLFFFLKMEI